MNKRLFQFILWQDVEKPKSKGELFVSLLYWCLILVLLILFVIGILAINMNSLLQAVLLFYIIPNLLFLGASRGIALRKSPPSLESYLMSGGQLTIFFTLFHVIWYLRKN